MSLDEEEIKLPIFDGVMWLDEEGCAWQTELDFIQIEILGFCGCGDPDAVTVMVRDVLRMIKTKRDGLRDLKRTDHDIVFTHSREMEKELFGDNDVVRDFVYYRLDDLKLIEHGTIIGESWLTKRGENLLSHLDRLLTEETAE